jgi:hypothetical protein
MDLGEWFFAHILHLFLQVLAQNERKGQTFLGRDLDTTIHSYDWRYKTKNSTIPLHYLLVQWH